MGSHDDDSQPKQKDETLKVYIDSYLIAQNTNILSRITRGECMIWLKVCDKSRKSHEESNTNVKVTQTWLERELIGDHVYIERNKSGRQI